MAAVAALTGIVWCAASGRSAPEQVADLKALAGESMPSGVLAADIARTLDGVLFAGKLPATFPEYWKRRPCEQTQREVRSACFLVLEQRPPCADGYEHEGRCLVPIAATAPAPNSIQHE